MCPIPYCLTELYSESLSFFDGKTNMERRGGGAGVKTGAALSPVGDGL